MNREKMIELGQGALVSIRIAKGTTVVCSEGALWMTQDGNLKDIVLQARESFLATHSGIAVLHALRPATVGIESPPSTGSRLWAMLLAITRSRAMRSSS